MTARVLRGPASTVRLRLIMLGFRLGGEVAQRVERWTCVQQVVGLNPIWGKSCVTTLGKLFTPTGPTLVNENWKPLPLPFLG